MGLMARLLNRLAALLVGAVLIAGGALVIIEAVWTWTGSGFVWIPGRSWLTSFKTTPWSNNLVIAISIGVAIVGFVLLVVEVRPQRKRVARYRSDHGTWLLMRRSTEAHLSRRLETAVPTSPIKVRLSPRALRWRVMVTARAARSTRPALEAAARAELDQLHAPSTKVQVRTTGAKR
jgi:hypothetical protein